MYEDFQLEISDINNLKTGRIRVGITNHLGILTLPQAVKRFHDICPFVEVLVTEDNTLGLEKRLIAGELDFVIMHAPADFQPGRICYKTFFRDPFVLVMAQDHPLASKAAVTEGYPYPMLDIRLLEGQPMIRLNPDQRIRQVTDMVLKRAGIRRISTFMTLRNHTTAQLMAAQGLGVTMVPLEYSRLTVEQERSPILLSIDNRYEAWWDMCVATLEDSFMSKADQLFIRCVSPEAWI